jgi:regulator of sigma E protease
MSWFLTILGIVLLIVLHELGHFLAAKAVGMRVERFSLFFPPTLARLRRGETEYAIGAIPAGGYVKITGMNPEEIAELEPEVARRAYYNQAPWKRVVVILAGPGVNLLIAFVLFWVIIATGNLDGNEMLASLNPSVARVVSTTGVGAIEPGMPAAGVLKRGDRILRVDGKSMTVLSAQRAIGAHRCPGAQTDGCRAATPVQLTIRRGARTLTVSAYPRYNKQAGRMIVGFDFAVAARQLSVPAAAGVAVHEMWSSTTHLLSSLGRAFTSAKVRHEFHSIVGITELTQEAVAAGAGYALALVGFLSLVLAVLNLLPFLPLDGGHVLWAVAEKLRGRRISVAAMWRFSSVGIVLLLFLVINGLSNDISPGG